MSDLPADSEISTAARIHSLEMLRDDFNLDAIATVLTKRGEALGFRLIADQKVYDLISRTFVTQREERGGTLHNDLFWKNEKIKEIFPSKPHPSGRGSIVDFDEGLPELSQLRLRQEEFSAKNGRRIGGRSQCE